MKEPLFHRICPCTGMPFIKLLEFVFWGILILSLVTIPSYIVSKHPSNWNSLAQVLFQLITALLSITIGYRLNTTSCKRSVTRKWLRPAQTACNQIQVMGAQVNRLRKTRKTTCDELQDLIKDLNDAQRKPIEKVVRTKCESCKARLLDIENHLQNAYETWRVFIRENCDRIVECKEIESELIEFSKSLKQ